MIVDSPPTPPIEGVAPSQQGRRRGSFIVLEGVDRCGKTTQVQRLLTHCLSLGLPATLRRFPNRSTVTGQIINQYLTSSPTSTTSSSGNAAAQLSDQAIHLLFCANRWEAADEITATLQAGTHVICDRYAASGVAFTAAKGVAAAAAASSDNNPNPSSLLTLDWCMAPDVGLPAPDAILFLDMDPTAAAQRGGYGEERYEKLDFQKVVRQQFHRLQEIDDGDGSSSSSNGKDNDNNALWHNIDATQDMDTVQQNIWSVASAVMERAATQPVGQLWVDKQNKNDK